MKKYWSYILVLLSFNSFSQNLHQFISEGTYLFTYKDQSYLISEDSIYSNLHKLNWEAKKHNLQINNFTFIQDGKKGYLMHNSGGIIYEFDGNNFRRLDESFEFNTQYQSFPFLYNGSIYNFGGYGLFTFKNIITYFNESKKETELVYTKTPISKLPVGRKNMFGQIIGDNLFIGAGYGYDNDIQDGYKDAVVFSDYWVFDLISKEWNRLGTGKPLLNDDKYSVIYDFNGKNLILSPDKIFTIDIKNNKIVFYENANVDLLKSNKRDAIRNLITYNKHLNGFYLIIEKPNYGNKLIFVNTQDFLGKPTRNENIYSPDSYSAYYFLGGIILLIIILFFIKKRSALKSIDSKRKEIDSILNEEEKQILTLIYDKHPEFISFPELMDVFESHLSYESRM